MPRKKLNSHELSNLAEDIHHRDINYHTREIYLNRWVDDEEDGIDHKVASRFIKNLHLLERQGRGKITIHMCLGGGDWCYGMAMYDAIKSCLSLVHIIVYGEASSMSGVVLQAADRRIMMPHSIFMLHHGSIGFDSLPSQAASEIVKHNDKSCKIMLDIFAERAIGGMFFKEHILTTKKTREYIDATLKKRGDWYLTAQEALFYGFCDEVLE